jgi:carbon storage regulator
MGMDQTGKRQEKKRPTRRDKGVSTMLILSRRHEESVLVGGSNGFEHLLRVTVLEIRSGHVKLGFEVNKDVPVHREEVWERIRASVRKDCSKGGS